MKIMVASDIHGSLYYAKKIIDCFLEEKAEKLVLLGDIYYHGPRNPLPKDYNPMEVAKLLNSHKKDLRVLQGNCDAEVDKMISEFEFASLVLMEIDGKKFYFTHGHHYNKDHLPKDIYYDVLCYGHFHVNMMEKVGDKTILNPGSVSLPKEDSVRGYIIIENGVAIQNDIDGNIINQINL